MRKIETYMAAALCVLTGVLAGCHRDFRRSEIAAKAGDKVLTLAEVAAAVPAGLAPEDSLRASAAYVETWVRRQAKLMEAERILVDQQPDIEAMVEEYRNSLLTYRLDRYYIDRMVDTVMSDSLVSRYYDAHRQEFKLNRDIVKGMILTVPASFRMRTRIRELMGADGEERQQDFRDMAAKNNLPLVTLDEWTSYDEFWKQLPAALHTDENRQKVLATRRVVELNDGTNLYYVRLTDHLGKGATAPLSWTADVIRNILYNQRSGDVLREKEDSLYQAALENEEARIYVKKESE